MWVNYNSIDLKIEHVTQWDDRTVFDESNTDLLYRHLTITVRCVYNPVATALSANAQAPTSVQLEQALLTPRKVLTITIGGVVVVQSPLKKQDNSFFPTDCRTGPQPLACRVIAWHGEKTAVVEWSVETWITSCNADFSGQQNGNSVLVHRYEISHDIDELNYTTRTVTGRAVFRQDFLLSQPGKAVRVPDDFRIRLFHPVPLNMQREAVNVVQEADGCAVRYAIRDRENPLNLGIANPVVKLRGRWKAGIDYQELTSPAKRYVTVNVECWGRRSTKRQELITACTRAIAAFGFGVPDLGNPLWFYRFDIEVDLWDKYASATAGYYIDGWTAFVIGNDKPWEAALQAFVDFPENTADVATAGNGTNPRPPIGGARGTWLERMVSQAINGECGTPGDPRVLPGDAKNWTF